MTRPTRGTGQRTMFAVASWPVPSEQLRTAQIGADEVFALIRKRSDGPANTFLNINHFNRLLLVVSLAADPAHFGASQPPFAPF